MTKLTEPTKPRLEPLSAPPTWEGVAQESVSSRDRCRRMTDRPPNSCRSRSRIDPRPSLHLGCNGQCHYMHGTGPALAVHAPSATPAVFWFWRRHRKHGVERPCSLCGCRIALGRGSTCQACLVESSQHGDPHPALSPALMIFGRIAITNANQAKTPTKRIEPPNSMRNQFFFE